MEALPDNMTDNDETPPGNRSPEVHEEVVGISSDTSGEDECVSGAGSQLDIAKEETLVRGSADQVIPQLSHDQIAKNNFPHHSLRASSSRKSLRNSLVSGAPSSGSLNGIAELEAGEEEHVTTPSPIARSRSTRARSVTQQHRRHSKSASISQPVYTFRQQINSVNSDFPNYPDQTYAFGAARPTLPRSRSSHPNHGLPRNSSQVSTGSLIDRGQDYLSSKTADSTPVTSPGLFDLAAVRASRELEKGQGRPSISPLHSTYTPKDTKVLDKSRDVFSGHKMLNDYEVLRELGRGVHGKVKLARDVRDGTEVAIKIVARKQRTARMFGRINVDPQEHIKREVAILKKARHNNVVGLLEVIDDDTSNKVYLILDFVVRGEISWRRIAPPEIVNMIEEKLRYEADSNHKGDDDPAWVLRMTQLKARLDEAARRAAASVSHWHTEDDADCLSRVSSSTGSVRPDFYQEPVPDRLLTDQDCSGQSYVDQEYSRPFRKQSSATIVSHMSSEHAQEDQINEHTKYVPVMTFEEIRKVMQDLLQGLEFLHTLGIVHRDIKPGNLLRASNGDVKISDFGVSYFGKALTEGDAETETQAASEEPEWQDDETALAKSAGTKPFWAPEACSTEDDWPDGEKPKVTKAIDLWAAGVTLYCLVYGRLPFFNMDNEHDMYQQIIDAHPRLPAWRIAPVDDSTPAARTGEGPRPKGKRWDYDWKTEKVSKDLLDLISKLLTKHPKDRMTIQQAKSHPWVLENIEDKKDFLEPPETKDEKVKDAILQPSAAEVASAVQRRTFTDIVKDVGRNIRNLMIGGRKRGTSIASEVNKSTDSVPATAEASLVAAMNKDKSERGRSASRPSLYDDEASQRVAKSRESTVHPLAQSQTTSPDERESPSYFSVATAVEPSPAATALQSPLTEDLRPVLTGRAPSSISTATVDSVSTIRASDVNKLHLTTMNSGITEFGLVETDVAGPLTSDAKNSLRHIFEGSKTAQPRLRESSSHSNASRSSSRTHRSTEPEALKSQPAGNVVTKALSPVLIAAEVRSISPARNGSADEASMVQTLSAPTSDPSSFAQAQEMNQRRLALERRQAEEEQATRDMLKSPQASDGGPSSSVSCPPSPDDLRMPLRARTRSIDEVLPPLDTTKIDSKSGASSTVASSIGDFAESSVGDSRSRASMSQTSGASSPVPNDDFRNREYESIYANPTDHDVMRTSETVVEASKPTTLDMQKPRPLRNDLDEGQYGNEDDDGDSDDSDEGIMMMAAPRKA